MTDQNLEVLGGACDVLQLSLESHSALSKKYLTLQAFINWLHKQPENKQLAERYKQEGGNVKEVDKPR